MSLHIAARPRRRSRIKIDEHAMTGLEIRELVPADFERGYLETLGALAAVNLTPEEARRVFDERPVNSYTFVAERNNRIVGTTSLLVDQKFIHGGGRVGHIEDVAVARDAQRQGIGTELVRFAVQRAQDLGCYKVILHCFAELSHFYERMNFRSFNIGMRLDLTP